MEQYSGHMRKTAAGARNYEAWNYPVLQQWASEVESSIRKLQQAASQQSAEGVTAMASELLEKLLKMDLGMGHASMKHLQKYRGGLGEAHSALRENLRALQGHGTPSAGPPA